MKPKKIGHKRGIWICGETQIGKSFLAESVAEHMYGGFFHKWLNKWWDGYQDEKVAIMHEVGPQHDCLDAHFKIWTDEYGCTAENKSGGLPVNHEWLIVTS